MCYPLNCVKDTVYEEAQLDRYRLIQTNSCLWSSVPTNSAPKVVDVC